MSRLAILVSVLSLFACTGCPPRPVPTKPPDAVIPVVADMSNSYGLPDCPATMTIAVSDVCDGEFTGKGLACAHCTGASACFDRQDAIYCAAGGPGCASDPACVLVRDGTSGIPVNNSRLSRKVKVQLKRRTPK